MDLEHRRFLDTEADWLAAMCTLGWAVQSSAEPRLPGCRRAFSVEPLFPSEVYLGEEQAPRGRTVLG